MIRHFAYARIEPDSQPDYKNYVAKLFSEFLENLGAKPLDKNGEPMSERNFIGVFRRFGWGSLMATVRLEWDGQPFNLLVEKDYQVNARSEGHYDDNGNLVFRKGLTLAQWTSEIDQEYESRLERFVGDFEIFLKTKRVDHKFVRYNENGRSLDKST
ncbi:hypothetical protein ACFLZB_02540 [Nanoarchaeota archaeon]